jgi:hypothetical protein
MSDLVGYLRPPARSYLRVWCVIVALAAAAAWLSAQALAEYEAVSTAEQAYARLLIASRAKPVRKVDRAQGETLKRWEELRKERAFAWTPIFLAVERSASEDIELLEFRPEKATGYLVMRGEARDHQALVVFLNNIALQAPFERVHLTYQSPRDRGAVKTIEFGISASLHAM